MIIHSLTSRRRVSRRLDRLNANIAVTLEVMKSGAALHFGASRWWLSTGRSVDANVARAVIRNASVAGVGDALFSDVASQTYRYIDET
jgi:hypothetical protein